MSTVDVYAAATLDREERDYYQIVVEVSAAGVYDTTHYLYMPALSSELQE